MHEAGAARRPRRVAGPCFGMHSYAEYRIIMQPAARTAGRAGRCAIEARWR